MPPPTHPDFRFYGTTEVPNIVEKAAGAVQDKLKKEQVVPRQCGSRG